MELSGALVIMVIPSESEKWWRKLDNIIIHLYMDLIILIIP